MILYLQAQLAELYSTYLSLYWQSFSQSDEISDLDLRRISDMLGDTAAAPAPIVTPPAPAIGCISKTLFQ